MVLLFPIQCTNQYGTMYLFPKPMATHKLDGTAGKYKPENNDRILKKI